MTAGRTTTRKYCVATTAGAVKKIVPLSAKPRRSLASSETKAKVLSKFKLVEIYQQEAPEAHSQLPIGEQKEQ